MSGALAEVLRRSRARAEEVGVEQAVAEVAAGVAERGGLPPPSALPPAPPGAVPAALARPELLGQVYEELQQPADRRRGGVYFTPPPVAAGLVALALPRGAARRGLRILDPSVGGGAVLLAAARRLVALGRAPAAVLAEDLLGVDVDPLAVRVATAALELWGAEHGVTAPLGLGVADSLADSPGAWPVAVPPEGVDVVVGNPPFQSQLRRATGRGADSGAALRERFGDAVGPYADTAWLFLVAALEAVRPGGRIALIQPESLLAARDAAGVRRRVETEGVVRHLWVAGRPVFAAATRVCVPVVDRRPSRARGPLTRSTGPGFAPAEPAARPRGTSPTWGWMTRGLGGVPTVHLRTDHGHLADWCRATAGFRDQYYGVTSAVREHRRGDRPDRVAPLVTSGLVDPLVCHWGERPASFARRRWQAPVIDLAELERTAPAVARWAAQRRHPKIVVASQTKVVEAAVDADGTWYPSTPTVAVHPVGDRMWSVAAVLLAPPVSAWVLGELAGTGLGPGHLRLPARQLVRVPLPIDADALAEGAALARRATEARDPDEVHRHLLALGAVMCAAYGTPDSVADWWAGRLPDRQ